MAAFAGLLFGLAWVVGAPSASAGGGKPAPTGDAQHCVVSVGNGAMRCFHTATESISFATGGRVTNAPADMRAAVQDAKLTQEINATGPGAMAVVIGIEYYWENYGTPSLTFTGANACTTTTGDTDFYYAPLPNYTGSGGVNWNNNIRSFAGYNNCYQRMWDNSNCTGLLLGYVGSSADMGAYRDRTECIYWS
ncbi:hypothetical protein ACWEIJ_31130 [Lentzea sp. NPDC004789]